MILHDLGAIFIHIPKTAGNFLTKQVFGRYSRDQIVAREFHQDLEDRFEIEGGVTSRKHMTLSEYARVLDISEYYVIAGCRDPFDRLVSLYFSPHRWLRKQRWWRLSRALSGTRLASLVGPGYAAVPSSFSLEDFKQLVGRAVPQHTFLKGHERSRGLFLIRQENLVGDYARLARHFGLTIEVNFDTRVNASTRAISESQLAAAREIVAMSAHNDDRRFLGDAEHLMLSLQAPAPDGATRTSASLQ